MKFNFLFFWQHHFQADCCTTGFPRSNLRLFILTVNQNTFRFLNRTETSETEDLGLIAESVSGIQQLVISRC